jgi:hypothetical protein
MDTMNRTPADFPSEERSAPEDLTDKTHAAEDVPFQPRGDDDSEQAVLQEARDRAAYGWEYWSENHEEWDKDLRFIDGEQWDAAAKAEREADGRPCITINTLPQYIDQVYNDGLQNRPAISVHPSDSEGASVKMKSLDGKTNYTLAQVLEGIIRNSEYVYGAEHHLDTALSHGIQTGMGWLRCITKYANNLTMDQDFAVIGIRNRFSVLPDPDCNEPDFSDMNWCFVFTDMFLKEFDRKYEGKNKSDLAFDSHENSHNQWFTADKVRIAEYFTREPAERTLVQLSNGVVTHLDQLQFKAKGKEVSVLDELARQGITITRQRKINTWKVYRRLITGMSILEDASEWPGSTIPIIPVPGKRVDYADKTMYRGLTYHSKGAKQAENYFISASVERIGQSPKSPWIVQKEHIEGLEKYWDEANIKNRPYLPYNSSGDGSKPERTQPTPMPVAELQMAGIMTDKVKATIGMYDASVGARSNETSGKAIIARQREADTGAFVFTDNLAKALRRAGIIATEVVPKIYSAERIARLRDRDGSGDWVKLNYMVTDEQTGQQVLYNDIQAGKMDVVVTTGPSYTTQRMEATEALLEFVRVVPAAGPVILDRIAANMDWPGAQELAARLIKIVPPNILTDKEKEDNEVEPPQPTPEMQVEMKKAEAAIATADANKAMAAAKMKEAEARLADIQAAADGGDQLAQKIKQLVAEAVAELIAQGHGAPPSPQQPNPAATAAAPVGA